MIEHEQAMARARKHVLSQRQPADPLAGQDAPDRRQRYDVIAHLLRLQASCDKERAALADERQRNATTRAAVLKHARAVRVIFWLGAALATAMFATGFYLIQRNREAIEVGCLVVVQVVRDSGANSGKPRRTPAAQAQARITAKFYKTLLGIMTPVDRTAVLRDQAIVRKAGGAIPEPQCSRIARDPARVRRETLQEP